MLSSTDYLVLKVSAEVHKIITVSGNSDDQVTMLLRLGLGFFQGLSIDNIKLNVMAVHYEISPYKMHKLVNTLSGKDLRIQFHVQQSTACSGMV